jgi:hypothetical protein
MPGAGDREAFLTADYNAEMIEHIARYPRIRDRAIFVGDPDDIVPDTFGPGLPLIRDWTERHYDFAGYITGFDPRQLADREALGYRPDERVCIVTVGGSGVGGHLLRRVIAAFPEAKERVPDLRMIVVAGPRIDPASLPADDGLEIRPYVHELYRQRLRPGGRSSGLNDGVTANRRPFLYSRSATTSSRTSTSATGSSAPRRAPHGLPERDPSRHRRRDRTEIGREWTTARSPPTAPPAPPPCSPPSSSRNQESAGRSGTRYGSGVLAVVAAQNREIWTLKGRPPAKGKAAPFGDLRDLAGGWRSATAHRL